MKFLRKHLWFSILFAVFLVLLLWSLWGNKALLLTRWSVVSHEIPDSFDGFRIAQISDLHNAQFGENNEELLTLLAETKPDMIAITGDLVDSRRTDLDIAVHFIRECVNIAPTYYVPGNHEARIPARYAALKAEMDAAGVVILENESINLVQHGDSITLTGLMDPDFGLAMPAFTTENYHVVLSHRPELMELYAEQSFDLVFTGHAHGGQFRLPFLGGLLAPHQGLFPQYTEGVHTNSTTTLVISRGLGNIPVIPRFNNRPELVLVTLECN